MRSQNPAADQAAHRRGDAAEHAGDERHGVGRGMPVARHRRPQVLGGSRADRQEAQEQRQEAELRAPRPTGPCRRVRRLRHRSLSRCAACGSGTKSSPDAAQQARDPENRSGHPRRRQALRQPQSRAAAQSGAAQVAPPGTSRPRVPSRCLRCRRPCRLSTDMPRNVTATLEISTTRVSALSPAAVAGSDAVAHRPTAVSTQANRYQVLRTQA